MMFTVVFTRKSEVSMHTSLIKLGHATMTILRTETVDSQPTIMVIALDNWVAGTSVQE